MTVNSPRSRAAPPGLPPHAPRVSLSVATENGSSRCQIDTPVVLVGSRRDCDLPLAHPDVSKIHCAVVSTGDAILVRDLLSRSGTFVNDQLIRTMLLRPGDTVRVGPVQVDVEFPDAAAPPPPTGHPEDVAPLRFATPVALETRGERAEIAHNATVIGRRNSADVVIDTPDVSLAHALLFTLEGRPVICDLGSRSGTFRNGERVELAWLNDGDELGIGGEKLTVRWAGGAAAAHDLAPDARVEPITLPERAPPDAGGLSELDQRRVELDQLATQLADQRRRQEARQAELAGERSRLDDAGEALAQQRIALSEKVQACSRTERELQQREKEIAERESALRTREAEAAATVQRIAQLKSILRDASGLFAAGEVPVAAPGHQPESPQQSSASEQGASPLPAAAQDTPAPTHAPSAGGDDLPAPMVEQPLFRTDDKSQPPADWPAELRKRFRMLRRVSSKTNEELLVQIWAEREKIRVS